LPGDQRAEHRVKQLLVELARELVALGQLSNHRLG
jgi:hypothetical protein